MLTLVDLLHPADHRVLFRRLLEEPRQDCMLCFLHSTNDRVKFETTCSNGHLEKAHINVYDYIIRVKFSISI